VIRKATPEDLAAIGTIQGPSSWQPANYLDYDCRVAVVDGVVAGFLVSRQTGLGEREILNVAVAASYRRRGIARSLINEEFAAFRGTWFLEVRESNTAAIELYRTLGFQQAGHREGYYNDPAEAAIVMRNYS
jgi:[ribosomal protein S18]-alanine N-acetyltransferase